MITKLEGRYAFNGIKMDPAIGESAFKLLNRVALGILNPASGEEDKALRWIENRQALYDEEKLVFRVLGESAGWDPVESNVGMFGSPPRDPGIWDVDELRRISATEGERVRDLTPLNKAVIEWMFKKSASMGAAFEYVCVATLKHTSGISVGCVDHVIRQTASFCRLMQEKYPDACVLFSAMNEWDAHNEIGATLQDVNDWAKRFYRWRKEGGSPVVSFEPPGEGWEAEQWPKGQILVDHGGKDTFNYSCGNGPGIYKGGMIHPERAPSHRRWWEIPQSLVDELRARANGCPVGFTESMYYVDEEDAPRAEQWYRNRSGWTHELGQYIQFLDNSLPKVDYFIFHHEKAVQCDTDWPRPETKLEAHLKERFGSVVPEPPPNGGEEPPPGPERPVLKLVAVNRDEEQGLSTYFFEREPEVIAGGDEKNVLREHYELAFETEGEIRGISSFHGLDSGDIVEMDTYVYSEKGIPLFARSDHKEVSSHFDAWKVLEPSVIVMGKRIDVDLLCRVNGQNRVLPPEAFDGARNGNRLTARPHWGLRVTVVAR